MYGIVTFVLRRFPYTRPWGESMRGFLLTTVGNLGLGVVNAIPGLFTAAVIFLITRFLVRLLRLWFDAVERGRIHIRWIYPETARADPPAGDRAPVAVRDRGGLSVPARESDRRVQGRQRVSRPHGDVRIERAREPDHERLHAHLLARAAAGRLRPDWRRRRHGRTTSASCPPRSRPSGPRRVTIPNAVVVAQTTTDYSRLCRDRRRLHADVRHDWLRRALATGAVAPAAGCRADRGPPPGAQALRASDRARGFLREVHALLSAWSARSCGSSRCTHCTRTSRISSTSTASRSCRRTTSSIPPRRRSWPRRTGSPRRLAPIRHQASHSCTHRSRRMRPCVAATTSVETNFLAVRRLPERPGTRRRNPPCRRQHRSTGSFWSAC